MTDSGILDLMLNNIGQGVIALDKQCRIVSCNKRAASDLEFWRKEGVPIGEVIKDYRIIDGIFEAVNKNAFITFDIDRYDGEIFELRLLPVQSSEISIIVVSKKVTDVRKAALAKQEFFANAGHELNTPLSSIIGFSEMLVAGANNDAESSKKFAKIILKEASRMKLLIDDMLKISALEENQEIADKIIDLHTIVGSVVDAIGPKAKSKNITVEVEISKCRIFANEEKITEVVANLVDNAVKYTNEGGRVRVTLRIKGGLAVLKVSDNGIGIPMSSLSRVYERFYRVDKGRSSDEGGTGLGLAIVKHICSHYKAPIRLQSKVGVGTSIKVSFEMV